MLKKSFNTSLTILIILYFSLLIFTRPAYSAEKQGNQSPFYTEISLFGSASKYANSGQSETFVTAWGASLGFTFAGTETVELEYKNAYQKAKSPVFLVKTFYTTYGVNYLHALSSGRFRPFLKIGVGYVESKYSVISEDNPTLETNIKRPATMSYTGGFGMKIYLTRAISFNASYTAQYIDSNESANGDSNTEFNYFLTGGLSFIF